MSALTMNANNDSFNWKDFVSSFDWASFYKACFKANFGRDCLSGDWGIPVDADGYRITPLNLSLTFEDFKSLKTKCGSFGTTKTWRYVFKLTGNLLFIVYENDGSCEAIIRFEKVETGFLAVEVLEDISNLNELNDPGVTYVVQFLSDLLPGCRRGLVDEDDDATWFWREPGDLGYTPDTNPWYAMNLKHMTAPDLSMSKTIPLKTHDSNGKDSGPIYWTDEDVEILRTDPRLCHESLDWSFHFENDRLLIFRNDTNKWRYLVDFIPEGTCYVCDTAIVNSDENQISAYYCLNAVDDSVDIRDAICKLLLSKRAYNS